MSKKASKVLFASAVPDKMDRDHTLPARFRRLLDLLAIRRCVRGRTVAIKMHFGGSIGYTTIHPLFVKLLVDHVKKGRPRRVFLTDGSTDGAADRGYARETVGAELVPAFGRGDRRVYRKPTGWARIETVLLSRPVLDADVLVNFSHVKGHGDCGFGGACKNLGMGCVPRATRRQLHALEGDLEWDGRRCIRCGKCIRECPTRANSFRKGRYEVFWHDCKMCRHCMLACPTGAIVTSRRNFDLFQEGVARVAKLVVDNFRRGRVFHINVLTAITPYCDCWGLSTPALVPDIGIMAGRDIVAVEQATLDAIKVENVIPGSIPPPLKLGRGRHLFEKLHARDPYTQPRALEELGAGTRRYRIEKVV